MFTGRTPRRWSRESRLVGLFALILAGASLAFAAAINSSRWLNDARYLSSPEMKGRGSGLPELDKAADYIANEFRRAGLEPIGSSFFQPFTASTGADLGRENVLAAVGPAARTYRLRTDFIPLSFSGSGDKTGALAFAGYGITAPEYNYDDYKGIDVSGRIVLVLRHEPQETEEGSIFRGRETTRHAEFVNKAINARNHGAIALLVVNDPVNHSGRDDRLVPFGAASGPENLGIPVVQIKQEVATAWMQQAGYSLIELQKAIDRDLSSQSRLLPESLKINLKADVRQVRSDLKNVIGVLRGSDPKLRDEYIVIGGHYDHLGYGEQGGSMAPSQTGQIHHGADDNASGTAGVMELARILSQERSGLRRSVLFMLYSGEELGLLGSAHYVQQPLVPIDRTIAMLNLDMIGRLNNNKLFVGGTGTSPGFRKLLEGENGASGFDLDFSELGYAASDHASFGRSGVPVMFFFTGLHADYHKPSDTWEKLDPVGTAKILELVARVTRRIDATDARPAYTAPPPRGRGGSRTADAPPQPGYGVYFGSMPEFGYSEPGVKFADIREGSPASVAGLRAGDVLIKFDGSEIRSLEDFTYALQGKQPGDTVAVVVRREGKDFQASVKLGRRE
jgi:hypothetical protein